jgi:hypothetical protein
MQGAGLEAAQVKDGHEGLVFVQKEVVVVSG